MITSYGRVYLTIALDCYSKKIADYQLNIQSKTRDWLEALSFKLEAFKMAVNNRFPYGFARSSYKRY